MWRASQRPTCSPGSYGLVALGNRGKQSYFARLPVEVGPSAPDPIELVLTPGDKIAGTLVIEVDAKQPPNPNPRHVMLNSAGTQIFGARLRPKSKATAPSYSIQCSLGAGELRLTAPVM